jgi:hypothetical protein
MPATSKATAPMVAGDHMAIGQVPTMPSQVIGESGQAMMLPVVVIRD